MTAADIRWDDRLFIDFQRRNSIKINIATHDFVLKYRVYMKIDNNNVYNIKSLDGTDEAIVNYLNDNFN